MKDKIAENLFHGEQGYNCTQSVFKTFQEEFKISDQRIIDAAAEGGGRVDGGICGAFYAVKEMIEKERPELVDIIASKFLEKSGSMKCTEITSKKCLSCKGCVGLASKLLDSYL